MIVPGRKRPYTKPGPQSFTQFYESVIEWCGVAETYRIIPRRAATGKRPLLS